METNARGFLRDRARLLGWLFVACGIPGALLLTAGVSPGVALTLVFLGSAVAAWRANLAMLIEHPHHEVEPLPLRPLATRPGWRFIRFILQHVVLGWMRGRSWKERPALMEARVEEMLPDVSVLLDDRLPPKFGDNFVAKAKAAGFSVAPIERRAPELYASVEWLVPTAIVLFVSRSFISSLLMGDSNGDYQATKAAILELVRSTCGRNREIKFTAIANAASPYKVTPGPRPSLSVRIVHSGRARVWFFFPADLESGLHAQAVQTLLDLAHELSSDPVHKEQGASARDWRPLIYTFDSDETVWKKVELLPARNVSE